MQEENQVDNTEMQKIQERDSIISTIKKSQMQNGLKHSSYHDYRNYCTKKIKKLRGRLGIRHGKKTFKKTVWNIENPSKIEHLYVPQYYTEKYWAYAMELRQVPKDQKRTNKIKYNIRGKLKKAVKWSNELSSLSEKIGVKRVSLEAETIKSYIQGLQQLEYKNYENALEFFMKSKKIMSDLREIAGIIQKAHLQERIEMVEHNIRFCKYNLKQFDSDMQNELMEMQNLMMQDSTLADKLENLVNEVKKQENKTGNYKIKFFESEIEVQNQQVVSQIQGVELLNKNIVTQIDDSVKLDRYLEIFSKYDEAMRICNKEIKEKAASEAVQKIWDNINTYLTYEKNLKVIERNEILLNQLRQKLIEENGLELIFHTKTSFKHTKPQDLVKLCDNILVLVKENKEITVDNVGRAPVEEMLESYYGLFRCFFVSCYHVMSNNYLYAISLISDMDNKLDFTKNEIETMSGLNDKQKDAMTKTLDWIKDKAYDIRIKSHVTLLEENQKNIDDLVEDVKDIEIKEGKKIKKEESIYDIVKHGRSMSKATGKKDENKVLPFVSCPPDAKILPPKAILLDVCPRLLEYPDIQDKIPAQEEKKEDEGLTTKLAKGIWGFFGGGN